MRAFAEQEHCDVLVVVHLHPDARVAPSAAMLSARRRLLGEQRSL
nr:hypothetical protein [Streptomyces bicolor]